MRIETSADGERTLASPMGKRIETMKYPIECPNCGGPLEVALVELDQEMKVCIDPQCGWEESDGDPMVKEL